MQLASEPPPFPPLKLNQFDQHSRLSFLHVFDGSLNTLLLLCAMVGAAGVTCACEYDESQEWNGDVSVV